MKNRFLALGALTLGAASVASADFTGWSAEVFQVGGYYVMNVYATSNAGGDQMLNVHSLSVQTNNFGGFYQSSGNPFWAPGAGQNLEASVDSWITMGTHDNGNAHDGTVADANLANFDDAQGATDFTQLTAYGDGAGWGVGNPNQNVNVAKALLNQDRQGAEGYFGILVAHFVVDANAINSLSSITFRGAGTYNGDNVGDERNFAFIIPGPGALALLGLSGLAASRRRRA